MIACKRIIVLAIQKLPKYDLNLMNLQSLRILLVGDDVDVFILLAYKYVGTYHLFSILLA